MADGRDHAFRVAWCAGQPAKPEVAVPADRFLNLTGCPMDQMIALVRQPATFIGNDSGPMHLSAASGNRVLAIFGPTSPRRFGPFPLDHPKHRAVEAPGGRLADLEPAIRRLDGPVLRVFQGERPETAR